MPQQKNGSSKAERSQQAKMKKIRRIKIRFQANEILIVRRDAGGSQHCATAQAEPPAADSVVSICPLCRSTLTDLPSPKEISGSKDTDLLNEAEDLWKKL